jgi:hypothetical protein
MTNWQTFLSFSAGFLSIASFVPYIITTLQGKTKPSRVSWWLWVILAVILCASYYSAGAGITLWAFICAGIGQFLVAVLSLKYGQGGWTRLDRVCLAGAGISLFLWWSFNSPTLAILFNIVIDVLAVLPTVRKSFIHPEEENFSAWSLYTAGSFLNLFTIGQWSFEIAVLPIYVFMANAAIVVLLLRPHLASLLSRNFGNNARKRKYLYRVIFNSKDN